MTEGCISTETWKRKDVFPSIYGRGADLVEDVLQVMTAKEWSQRDIFAVNLALVEAITNAIDHGNQCDPQKNVFVSCRISNNLVEMSVRDEGSGFSKDTLPDPRNEERLDLPTGRGVLLIYGFMTKVWFNDPGNELFMEKVRTEEA